ncbi:MAG: biopolymer transporter ExbD [Pseudomonadota bacterium]
MPQSEVISLGTPIPRRRPSLTPMIDVVFLLLVFFMLAARFGFDNAMPLSPALAGGGEYKGAPRLVSIGADSIRLNGRQTSLDRLSSELSTLMPDRGAVVVLRAEDGTTLQDLVTVIDTLSAAGMTRLVLAE